jgi:hypothetical protein
VIYFVTFLLLLSIAANVVLVQRWYKLARVVLGHEEAIEECLDGINSVHMNVDKILQSPLATNDPKVTQIHRELMRARDYLLYIANRLTSGWSNQKEDAGVDKSDG